MTPKVFRTMMFLLAVFAVLGILIVLLILAIKPRQCPAARFAKCPPSKYVVYENNEVESRDRRVLNDPLHPPTNRTSEQVHRGVTQQIKAGNLYQNTDDMNDGFRLIGYVTSNEHIRDAGGNTWQLFGRMKDRHQGEYYMVPSNRTIDLKVPLTQEVVVGERLRDVYTLPNEMRFKSAMLNSGPYTFTEIPKEDLGSVRYI